MPFTFVHPIFVLPFTKLSEKRVSATGVIMGSMVPDFEYFLRVRADGIYGHTFAGVFWFDLPLALLMVFLFHGLVRNPLIEHLPVFLKQHLARYTNFNWSKYFKAHWLVVLLSILFGTATHLLADSFTHYDGYFVQQLPVLKQQLSLAGFDIPLYKLLQHGFSPVGALILLAVVLTLPKTNVTPIPASVKLKYWVLVIIVTAVVVALAFLTGLPLNQKAFGHFVVAIISGGLLGLVLAGLVFRKNNSTQKAIRL